MNTSTKYFLLVLAAALAIGGITFLNRADNGTGKLVNKVDRSVRPVETTVATPTTLEETIERTGVLEPARDVQLMAEVAGKVRRVHRDLGDTCKAGDALISLDAETYRIALQDALASLEQTRAGLSEAERHHGRAEKLEARELASDQDMDRARSAVDTARAMNQRAEAAVALARRNLREATIRCPFGGVVAERMVDVGELVGPQTPLMRFVDHKELKLTLNVSAAELSRLQVGQPVELTDPSIPGAEYRGSVARLGVAADPATRTFPVEVTVEPGPRPGQVVRSVIHVAVHESAMVIAIDAVRFTESGPCVFVVKDGFASQRMVELGARVGHRVVVVRGIEPDERLVTVGVHGLESGDAVRPVDRPGETGAKGTAPELTPADVASPADAEDTAAGKTAADAGAGTTAQAER